MAMVLPAEVVDFTSVEGNKELRRYHLHETHVQLALYEAVRRAKLTKRVSSHTFRHSFEGRNETYVCE